MKYRLIRFSPNGEALLDEKCVAPNQHGCNRTWLESNPGCSAVLIEQAFKASMKGGQLQTDPSHMFYILNPKIGTVDTSVPHQAPHPTWVAMMEVELMHEYKYLQMLKLTGSL